MLPDDPASAVAEVMTETHCDAVPVVTPAGDLLGLITTTVWSPHWRVARCLSPSPRRHGTALVTRQVPRSAALGDKVGS